MNYPFTNTEHFSVYTKLLNQWGVVQFILSVPLESCSSALESAEQRDKGAPHYLCGAVL